MSVAVLTLDRRARPCSLAALLLLGAALAGCGKSLPGQTGASSEAAVATVAGTGQLAASGLATKNTTRLGGSNPVADAAAVALATNPGLTPATRPQAVVLVNDGDWTAALAAAALASSPLNAPLLYSEANSLPALSAQALAALKPTGAALLGGAQVIEVGTSAAPAGYRTISLDGGGSRGLAGGEPATGRSAPAGERTGGESRSGERTGGSSTGGERTGSPAAVAAQVERLGAVIHGGRPRRVIVVGADGPPALAMPAAGLAAESGAPILPVDAAGIPLATRRVLVRLRHPSIYAVGPPAAVSHAVLSELARFGAVHRIYPSPGVVGSSGPGSAGTDPAENAIAVARFSDGTFGWDVNQPGHGLAFASASRPLDAPAAAPLSASGDYAPLLLLERPDEVPAELSEYLSDIKPAYDSAPESEYPAVRGAYNHGWLIGDGAAIAPIVQAELDTMLEIAPQSSSSSAAGSAQSSTPSPTEPSNTELSPVGTAPSAASPSTTSPATPTP